MTKIGDKIYHQRTIRRSDGSRWEGGVITGETKGTWLIKKDWYEQSVNKKTMLSPRDRLGSQDRYYTEQGMLDKIFCDQHARDIAAAVSVCADPSVLREIAKLVGKKIVETGDRS